MVLLLFSYCFVVELVLCLWLLGLWVWDFGMGLGSWPGEFLCRSCLMLSCLQKQIRRFHAKTNGRPEKVPASRSHKKHPLYKTKVLAQVPEGALTQQQVKAMLPPGASVWRGNWGQGHWWGHLPPHSRVSRSWLHGHRESAFFVLRRLWNSYLKDNGLTRADCPVSRLFSKT